MKCLVCGTDGAEPVRLVTHWFREDHVNRRTDIAPIPAPSPGAACSVECATLIYVRPFKDETPDERRLTSWVWRRRRAQVRGEPFNEPAPMDEFDRAELVRESMRRRSA